MRGNWVLNANGKERDCRAPVGLREREAALGNGDGAANTFGGFQPFGDDCFHVGERFFVGFPISRTARELRDFSDES